LPAAEIVRCLGGEAEDALGQATAILS